MPNAAEGKCGRNGPDYRAEFSAHGAEFSAHRAEFLRFCLVSRTPQNCLQWLLRERTHAIKCLETWGFHSSKCRSNSGFWFSLSWFESRPGSFANLGCCPPAETNGRWPARSKEIRRAPEWPHYRGIGANQFDVVFSLELTFVIRIS